MTELEPIKKSIAEFWMLYIVAFLLGAVFGICITQSYLINAQNKKFHQQMEWIRTK